jgi:hypothetical protein
MRLLKTDYAHAAGNSYTSIRQRRVNVNCEVGTNTTQARFYFPDIPDLTDKQIVNIEAHCAQGDEESNNDIANTIAPNGFEYWSAYQARYCFLNLINDKKENAYINFPAYMFFNPKSSGATFGTKSGKLMPVNSKLLFRECFIFVPNGSTLPPGISENFTASFTFFHLD